MANRVVVIVEGGLVQGTASDDPKTNVIVIDWDNVEQMDLREVTYLRRDLNRYLSEKSGGGEVNRFLREAMKELDEQIKVRKEAGE